MSLRNRSIHAHASHHFPAHGKPSERSSDARRQLITHRNVRALATPFCVAGLAICLGSPHLVDEAAATIVWAIVAFIFGVVIAAIGAFLFLRAWRCPNCGKRLGQSTYSDNKRIVCSSCHTELRL